MQDKQIGGTLSRSASDMISFELSGGHPYGPHVPTAMDDDQYVEYQLDDLAGFPSNVEEEERVRQTSLIYFNISIQSFSSHELIAYDSLIQIYFRCSWKQ